MDDRTLAQIAPSGDFGNTFTINCDNPLMSRRSSSRHHLQSPDNTDRRLPRQLPGCGRCAVQRRRATELRAGATPIDFFDPLRGNTYNQAFFQLLRRNTEGGPRISDLRHQSCRGVLGMRGDLSKVWSYDTYFQYGRTNYTQVYKNEFSVARLNRALNVVNVDAIGAVVPVGTPAPASSAARCSTAAIRPASRTTSSATAPSAAAINYLNVFGVIQGITSEQIANVNFTGLLGEMG